LVNPSLPGKWRVTLNNASYCRANGLLTLTLVHQTDRPLAR